MKDKHSGFLRILLPDTEYLGTLHHKELNTF